MLSRWLALGAVWALWHVPLAAGAQSFSVSHLDLAGADVSLSTSLQFGPDGRLYVLQLDGTIDVFTIQRNGPDDYEVVDSEELPFVRDLPNRNDDGSASGTAGREATGIAVGGTPTNPVIYASSSDPRVGGPSGDKDLDTNSGVITRIAWQGADLTDPTGSWQVVDLVRGLPRSEENHATNGLEIVTIGGDPYLLVASGGHTNAGSPSTNFAWHTEYALSAAILSVDLAALDAMPVVSDGGRDRVYDLPTLDDPTRANANGVDDPDDPGYDGVDLLDPWGGNDGLNQAKLVAGGPVQIFSPGYRNAYDLVATEGGAVYVTDNGANGGWGGYPDGEGLGGNATNDYRPGEPGSTADDPVHGDPKVNNKDHLHLVTTDIQSYAPGSYYGGHPAPVRANPFGAGLFTRGTHSSDPGDSNGNGYVDDWFRTVPYDPSAGGEAGDPQRALPADWPPVPPGLANPVEGDYRLPDGVNPDGPADDPVTTWANNTNGIDEYTATNFGGAMQGDLVAGRNGGGNLHRVELNPDGSLAFLTTDFISGLGGNALGVTANGDGDPFPGTIWVGTFDAKIVVLEPQDFVGCIPPGEPGYDADADGDADGYLNGDEEDAGSDPCNGGSQPGDFDRSAGAPLVSDWNDPDDDADGVGDAQDPMQLGDPDDAGSDAFELPVVNELFSDQLELGGYLGLGFTGMMNDGSAGPNWLLWLDEVDAGPNPNDVLGGAVGAMTMQMTEGSARGATNDQDKAFQYGVDVDASTGGFTVRSRLLNFDAGFQLYPFAGDGELGIFLGDGTQSDYVQLVLTHDGVELLQESGDVPGVPQLAAIAVGDRPAASLELELRVDAASGEIEAFYGVDGGPLASAGSVFAAGSVLDAIQQSGVPLMVGLIGSSHTPGAELEGTWDYLEVVGWWPSLEQPLPDVFALPGSAPLLMELAAYFDDDGGDGNLVFDVLSVSDPAIGAVLLGSELTLTFPVSPAVAWLTVRATDADGRFLDQNFLVSASDPSPIHRVNAGGPEIAAIDGGIPWSEDTPANGSAWLTEPGDDRSAGFNIQSFTPEVDLATTPAGIFQTERFSSLPGTPSLAYGFPVPYPGDFELRLYMGNGWNGTNDPGERVFDVTLEGVAHPDLTGVDLSGAFGHKVGGVVTHTVSVDDGVLDVEFFHGPANNPLVNGIEVVQLAPVPPPPPSGPFWIDKDEDESYTARHECSFVQAGDRFYLFGGRENAQTLDTYDPASDSWSTSASAPLPFNHFQALEHEGLVWVVGAFRTNTFPNEQPASSVWVYDPANDVWMQGPEIPAARRRGSAGLVEYGGRFYVVGGNTQGHAGGYEAWFDEYDPETGTWTPLPDAPRPRDHFHAAVIGDALYVAGGRLSGGPGGTFAPLVPEVDVYDFTTSSWSTLPPGSDLPTPRAAAATAVFAGELLVIGGEGGGQAFATVEALDPTTGSWRTLDALNHPRHGTQAVVSGQGVYVVAGSPVQGGGNQRNMEVYAEDLTAGAAHVAGLPNAPINVPFSGQGPETITLEHAVGSQGVFVESVSISGPDASDFSLKTLLDGPFVLPVGGSRDLMVDYWGPTPGAMAFLDVVHSGGQTVSVLLLPEPGAAASLAAGVLALAALARRRSSRPGAGESP